MANLAEGISAGGKTRTDFVQRPAARFFFEMYKLLESHQEARKPKFGK